MCVIVIKPAGIEIPDDIIRRCWRRNPDGAGLAYIEDDGVQIEKGFMQLNEFLNFYKSLDLKETFAIAHFRISTSGGINPGMTHPFPLTDSHSQLTAMSTRTPVAIVHNGIINCAPMPGLSDTATYIAETLAPRYKRNTGFYDNGFAREQILREIKSKMVILDKDFYYTIGNFTQEGGLYFSNLYWKNVI